MRMTLMVHILAGGVGLISGYVALYSLKGAPLHRKSGMLFVYAMLPMSITGMLISAVEGVAPAINIPSGLLAFYLVITGLNTVRPLAGGSPWLDIAGMLHASAVGLTCVALAFVKVANGGAEAGLAYPLFLFGGVGLAASVGDFRMIRAGGIRGASRLKRHLWRMCFALFVAAVAFFSSRTRVPAPGLLRALPMLAVLVTMFYWLWRVRIRPTVRGVVGVNAPSATAAHASQY